MDIEWVCGMKSRNSMGLLPSWPWSGIFCKVFTRYQDQDRSRSPSSNGLLKNWLQITFLPCLRYGSRRLLLRPAIYRGWSTQCHHSLRNSNRNWRWRGGCFQRFASTFAEALMLKKFLSAPLLLLFIKLEGWFLPPKFISYNLSAPLRGYIFWRKGVEKSIPLSPPPSKTRFKYDLLFRCPKP